MRVIFLGIISLFFCGLYSCKSVKKSGSDFQIIAYSYPYQAAMGSGSGVVFRLNIKPHKAGDFRVDSFFVNKKSLPFIITQSDTGLNLETDYFKSKSDPLIGMNGEYVNMPVETVDSITAFQKYEPSWILIQAQGKMIKQAIPHYFEIKTVQ